MSNNVANPQFPISRFSVVFSTLLQQATISDPAFRLLVACLSIREPSGQIRASNSELGRLMTRQSSKPMSRANVGRYKKELVESGLMVHDKNATSYFLSDEVLLSQRQAVVEPTTSGDGVLFSQQQGVVHPTTPEGITVVEPTTPPSKNARRGDSENTHPRHIYSSLKNTTVDKVKEQKKEQKKEHSNNDAPENTTTKNTTPGKHDTVTDLVDTETRELFPNAPCSLGVAIAYFDRFFESHAVENQNPRSTALDFFEYWENKRDWSKIPRNRKSPVRLDSWKAVRPHATTWACRVRDKAAGRDLGQSRKPRGKNAASPSRLGASSIWMTAEETREHAHKHRLDARHPKFYEHNGKKYKQARWRFLGFHTRQLHNPTN